MRLDVVTAVAARELGRAHRFEGRRLGRDDKQPVLRPICHAWRVEAPTAGSVRARGGTTVGPHCSVNATSRALSGSSGRLG